MHCDGILAGLGEAFLKGRNRSRFVDSMLRAVRQRLADCDGVTATKTHTNIDIALLGADPEPVLERLGTVFGIQRFQLYTQCAAELEAIKTTTLAVVNALENDGQRIKVTAQRSDKRFPLRSPELAGSVGRYVAEHTTMPIDIVNPDRNVKILILPGRACIVARECVGPGGLPIGVNGAALLMLSGGLDSPVAGYLTMKRGLAVAGLHFESPPHTSPRARQKVLDLAERLAHYAPDGRFTVHLVRFSELQKAIFAHVPQRFAMTVMRRMMYRLAEQIAQRLGCAVLANGESLGQVASQTPHSMLAIECVTTMPVIRPVVCMDKQEIIDIAQRIGTYAISIRPYEDCCTIFVPKNPSTAPQARHCETCEATFEWQGLLQTCADSLDSVTVRAGHPIRIDGNTSDAICALL